MPRDPSVPQAPIVQPRFWQRFPFRITLLFALPVYAVLLGIGVRNYQLGIEHAKGALQGKLHALTTALSYEVPPETGDPTKWTAADRERMRAVFTRIADAEPDISSIYVARKTGEPDQLEFAVDWVRTGDAAELWQDYDATQAPMMMAAFDGPTVEDEIYADEWGPVLSGYAPIRDKDGNAVAIVGCDVTAARVDAIFGEVLRTTAVLFVLAAIAIGIVGLLVARMVRIPLQSLVDMMYRVAAGDFGTRISLERQDEFGVLASHLDRMAAGLQEREHLRGIFGRYVSEGVAKSILGDAKGADVGGEERDVTVLFSDIRSYSTISERLSPTQTVGVLNEYMGAMGEVVEAHGGIVVEFLGDGVLAAFGVPQRSDDHPLRAVRCARAMDARLRELNGVWQVSGLAELWKNAGVPRLEARIGVHTGKVVAGNMGGPKRVKYTVFGEAVNVATAVEHLNNALGTRLLVTASTVDRLPPGVRAEAKPAGKHTLKKAGDVEVTVFTFPDEAVATVPAGRGTLAE
jgi:adenylate cyclase